MRKIIYTRPDGGVNVVSPVINTIGEAEGFTEADAEQRAWATLPKDAINPVFVDESAIPADRTFRNAWAADGEAVVHNIDKCKALAHERRRAAREAEFAPHDAVIAKRIPGVDLDAAESERAKIRTKYDAVQSAIDAASSVVEIKAALV